MSSPASTPPPASPPVLCLLLVLLVDATEVDESESDDESDPSSESDEEEDDDEDDRGDLPGGFESNGFVFTVVIFCSCLERFYLFVTPNHSCPRGLFPRFYAILFFTIWSFC